MWIEQSRKSKIMNQHTGTPKKWVNTSRGWHIDAVSNIVSPISFGFHGGAKRENVLFIKDPGENGGSFLYSNSNRIFLFPASVLAFFPIPKASLTGEGSEKKLR